MRVLDLFSGIGGFSLGLERAGMETAAFCEIEEFPRKVLKKHWPEVPCYEDIRELSAERLRADGVMADSDGGKPCEKERGRYRDDEEESGARGINETGSGGNDRRELGTEAHGTDDTKTKAPGPIDLICGGYPCQPFSTAGKRRGAEDDRHLWPEYLRLVREIRPRWVIGENVAGHISMGLDNVLADLESEGYTCRTFVIPACAVDAQHRRDRVWVVAELNGAARSVADNTSNGCNQAWEGITKAGINGAIGDVRWPTEPPVGRVAHGIPRRVDRLRALGNAVVPQVVEQIGRAIMETEKNEKRPHNPKQVRMDNHPVQR